MLFELLSTASMAGITGASFYYQNKNAANDHEKIVKIADEAGLKTKEGGIRIYRKSKSKNYTEYVYKVPLGLSFKDFEEKKELFIDGLNNKSRPDLNLANIKNINWRGDLVKQLKDIIQNRIILDKQIEMEYDGMLRIRVFEKGLDSKYLVDKDMLEKLKGWEVPVGFTYRDFLKHDFEKKSHMIVAGTTGFGKSEYLKLIISSLIYSNPNKVKLHLIDLKGGSELGPFRNLKQVISFGKTTKDAKLILQDVQKEMEKVSDWLFETGKNNVKKAGIKERHFVIIDEAATLDDESKEIVVDISRRGRSAGYRLIYATQYPTNETLPSQVRANIGARVCFLLETNAQSRAVLDEGGAEELPEIEGRAIFRRVKNYTVQTPIIEEDLIDKIIKPHIKEGLSASGKDVTSRKTGTNSFKLETVGLSNTKTNSETPRFEIR